MALIRQLAGLGLAAAVLLPLGVRAQITGPMRIISQTSIAVVEATCPGCAPARSELVKPPGYLGDVTASQYAEAGSDYQGPVDSYTAVATGFVDAGQYPDFIGSIADGGLSLYRPPGDTSAGWGASLHLEQQVTFELTTPYRFQSFNYLYLQDKEAPEMVIWTELARVGPEGELDPVSLPLMLNPDNPYSDPHAFVLTPGIYRTRAGLLLNAQAEDVLFEDQVWWTPREHFDYGAMLHFEIRAVAAVPEPQVALLAAGGGMVLLMRHLRRRQAMRRGVTSP